MVDKFSGRHLLVDHEDNFHEEQKYASRIKPPSEDSAHFLLKQALHSDDSKLLLDCLYIQDEKVFANSTSLLDPSDVPKLLDSFVSLISTGSMVLSCFLPWLRSLLLQHAGIVLSQGSSLSSLNSLYQLIKFRASPCKPDLQLSSCLYHLCAELEVTGGCNVNDDLNALGEKLTSHHLHDDDEAKSHGKQESYWCMEPQSADSVHILLKRALHADDHALLLDCLYIQDEEVIKNSTSLLSASDVLELLDSIVSLLQSSRQGAVLACSLPWFRSLLLQHAGVIIFQESSLCTLNSLYQLIESRASSCYVALQLSGCLDSLSTGVSDNDKEPIRYEKKDVGDDKEPEDAMDTD